jgi:tRNA-dihydrouridine synthase
MPQVLLMFCFYLVLFRWGTDLCFSPMIIAKDFVASEKARAADLQTNVRILLFAS